MILDHQSPSIGGPPQGQPLNTGMVANQPYQLPGLPSYQPFVLAIKLEMGSSIAEI